MQCHVCGVQLPAGTRFCVQCGAAQDGLGVAPGSVVGPGAAAPPRRSRAPKAVAGALVLGGLAAVGILVVSRGEAPTSGPWLKGIGREPVQVGESFELRGEYVDVGGVLGNLVLAGQDTDDDYYIDEIVAIDVMTGEEVWHEDGTSVAVLADLIYIADGDDVQGYDKDGKKIGDSASAEFGYVSGLRNRFLQVSYEGDGYGFDLVDPATMEVF